MPNALHPTNLQELLSSIGQIENPFVVDLTPEKSSNGFLMTQVLKRLKEEFKSKALFLTVSGQSSEVIKMELKLKKSPAILVIYGGEIKQVFSGIVPFIELEKVIQQYT